MARKDARRSERQLHEDLAVLAIQADWGVEDIVRAIPLSRATVYRLGRERADEIEQTRAEVLAFRRQLAEASA